MKIIIYGSKYGSAERYARELSERTVIEAKPYEQVKRLGSYDTVIYIGGLYGGRVLGLNKILKALPKKENIHLLIATVGLLDPQDRANVKKIRTHLKKKIPKDLSDNILWVHLRGAMDYSHLSRTDAFLMRLLCKKVRRKPPSVRTSDETMLVESYGGAVNFVDMNALSQITDVLWSIRKKSSAEQKS